MSLYAWFWANQALLSILNAAYLAGKQQIPMFIVFDMWNRNMTYRTWHQHVDSNPNWGGGWGFHTCISDIILIIDLYFITHLFILCNNKYMVHNISVLGPHFRKINLTLGLFIVRLFSIISCCKKFCRINYLYFIFLPWPFKTCQIQIDIISNIIIVHWNIHNTYVLSHCAVSLL